MMTCVHSLPYARLCVYAATFPRMHIRLCPIQLPVYYAAHVPIASYPKRPCAKRG